MTTLFLMMTCFLMFVLCVLLVFVFDDIVLNKHFTMKLHKRLGVGSDKKGVKCNE